MHDLLDQPAGAFDWGPEPRRWIPRRTGDSRDAIAAFWPVAAVVIGAALLAIGLAFAGASSDTASLDDAQQSLPSENGSTPTATEPAEPAVTATPVAIVVHVTGMVERPGIVLVLADDRATDAVEAAGGALPGADLAQVNLAARVSDGMQLHVPLHQPLDAAASTDLGVDAPSDITVTIDAATDRPSADPPTAVPPTVASPTAVPPTTVTATAEIAETAPDAEPPDDAAPDATGPEVAATPGPLYLDDDEPILSPELVAFLLAHPGEPTREELAPFLAPEQFDN